MLQSVPDPFDSYGPPREEDQIFSILPPLSIMTNAPSTSPSPLATTPEHEPVPELSSSSSSWGSIIPESTSQWSDIARSSSNSPQSVSPPSTTHRHSHPAFPNLHQSKSESKLRSVLATIDETHSRQPSMGQISSGTASLPSLNGSTLDPGNNSWSGISFGESDVSDDESGRDTPRPVDLIVPQLMEPPAANVEQIHNDLLDNS
jgi:hypothetical protein